MLSRLRGVVEGRAPDGVIVSVGPVSLKVHLPAPTLMQLGVPGQEVSLYTYLYVREDQLALYGFTSEEQLRWFELLLTVSRVGPRVALAVLSAASPDSLQEAIAKGDTRLLETIPGVGRKMAGRLILELQEKVELGVAPGVPSAEADLLSALVNLGYSMAEARAALASVPKDAQLSEEEKIVMALRYLAKG